MTILDYAINWIRGELLEATLITIASTSILIGAGLFWKMGTTGAAKGMVIPLLIVGSILFASGISMLVSNQKRLIEFERVYQQSPVEFVAQEKARVEAFLPWYKQIRIMVASLLAVGMGIIWFSTSPNLHGVAIGLILFALSTLVIDHFSNERAQVYYQQVLEQMK